MVSGALHKQAAGWNVSGTTSMADEMSLGSHLPSLPSSPKQILTVREGVASSSSLMSCDSSCSQMAAPTSVWLGSCFPGREEDFTVAANPQEREIPAQQAEWFGRVSNPTSVCTGGSDASNHGDLKKDWGKGNPYKRGGKSPREASAH